MGKPGKPDNKGMDARGAQRDERDARAAAEIAKDDRFKAVLSDPRFSRGLSRKQRTVPIDERFAGMFTNADFQTKASVDKRGRKLAGKQAKAEDLKRYYRLRDEDEWGGAEKPSEDTSNQQPTELSAKQQAATKAATQKASGGRDGGQKQPGKQSQKQPAALKAKQDLKALLEDEDMLESESESEEQQKRAGTGSETDEEQSEEEGKEDADARRRWERMRGIKPSKAGDSGSDGSSDGSDEDGSDTTSESSYDSADEPLTDEEEEDEDEVLQKAVAEWGVGALAANPAEKVPLTDETHRLAVLDQDWQHVRAVDLMVGLQSFVPKGGCIKRVTVYPSDYGLQRMAEEQVKGPQGILKPASRSAGGKRLTSDSGSGSEGSDDEDDEAAGGDGSEEEKELDLTRVRMYEASKLRYYYAIVECDSVATAVALYTECDGMEFEHSACKMDLRFVPDDQSFEGRQVRDTCTSIPANYQPPELYTTSLQHTDPTLTWDAEDANRKRILQKKVTEAEIKEADFAAFLASSESEEEDDDMDGGGDAAVGRGPGSKAENAAALRERYRALLLGGGSGGAKGKKGKGSKADKDSEDDGSGSDGGSDSQGSGSEGSDEEEAGPRGMWSGDGRKGEYDMEVSYVPALEGLGKKLLAAKRDAAAKKSESVWEAYLRRRKEKRKEKKNKRNIQDSSDDDSDGDDLGDGKARHNDDGFFAQADEGDDDPFNDPFFNDPSQGVTVDSEDEEGGGPRGGRQQTKGKGPAPEAQAGKQRKGGKDGNKGQKGGTGAPGGGSDAAELELLLMDDQEIRRAALKGRPEAVAAAVAAGNGAAHADVDDDALPKGRKAKRAAKKEKAKALAAELRDDDDGAAAGFAANLNDPRFKGLVTDHEFALDPTDPRYKALKDSSLTQQVKSLKKQRAKQGKAGTGAAKPDQASQGGAKAGNAAAGAAGAGGNSREFDELRGMVAKLKRKGQAQSDAAHANGSTKKQKL